MRFGGLDFRGISDVTLIWAGVQLGPCAVIKGVWGCLPFVCWSKTGPANETTTMPPCCTPPCCPSPTPKGIFFTGAHKGVRPLPALGLET